VHDPLKIKGATVQTALQFGTARLAMREDLRENAARDAQAILQIATGLTRVQMLAQPYRPLREEEAGAFQGMIAQRRGNVPIQHMRGSQEFFGREFLVTPDVLIPRPETEHIVEEVLRLYPDRKAALRFADVGTGSGILAITLALEYPQSTMVALDISTLALNIAKQNAAVLGVTDSVKFLQTDLFEALTPGENFDVIVSNPPYIPNGEAGALHPQVRDHEPHLALFGGDDGLDVIRRLAPQAETRLKPKGWLLIETAGRTAPLDAVFKNAWHTHFVPDLQSIERIVVAQKA
jgi:release factor glutamine methyltransferase